MDDIRQIIASNLVKLRKMHNMTQADLAEKINYTDKAISKWERGESIPDIVILKQVADCFGVKVDDLISPSGISVQKSEEATGFALSLKNHRFIMYMSIMLVWVIALLLFIILKMATELPHIWTVFVYAVPASVIECLILNTIWLNKRRNYLIISVLMWTILLTLFVAFYVYSLKQSWTVIFLGIPGQIIIFLWSRLKKHSKH